LWEPPFSFEVAEIGQQESRAIEEPIRLEVREEGASLQFRVCKLRGNFLYDVGVDFAEFEQTPAGNVPKNCGDAPWLCMKIKYQPLQTKGRSCSSWEDLRLFTQRINPGQELRVGWTVVSPASSLSDWKNLDCTGTNGASGTCFSGVDIVMKRTCK
jgi:hypothetical protein